MTAATVSRKQILEYLERPVADRVALRSTIELIKDKLPNTVIFGGMIRDFALAGARSFSSDVDLVSDADDSSIFDAIREFAPQKNKFGGYRFRVGKSQFDIWPLAQTWAFKQRLVKSRSFDGLLQTTFFNVDAAIFHLGNGALSASEQFSAGVGERVLEVNLEENPSPIGMARRAVNMAIEYDLAVGARLASYILRQATLESSWISETLRTRLEHHVATSDKPFEIAAQSEIPQV